MAQEVTIMTEKIPKKVMKVLFICSSCNNFGCSEWNEGNAECPLCSNRDVEWMQLTDNSPYGALVRRIEIQALEFINAVRAVANKHGLDEKPAATDRKKTKGSTNDQ
jgi:hypothetical protein